ncbi:hypothetical protein C8J57DRAFT_79322 [Mycena rebaudengoi]|nr:hypothetical protein C8J57DRAFT_79322 [Mycena rebaudengoi]
MISLFLPIEIIAHILSACWALPLSPQDRITLMTSAGSVNHTWRTLFFRLSSQDVHIPCPSFADHFVRTIRGRKSSLDAHDAQATTNRLCRSLTIRITNPESNKDVLGERELPMENALSLLLYRLCDLSAPCVPNLRRISIEYHNTGFDGIFDKWTLIAFPSQVTSLELSYSFSPETPPWLIASLRAKYERQVCRPPWTTPSVRSLSVFGAGSDCLVLDILTTCQNVKELVTDFTLVQPLSNSIYVTTTGRA